MLFLPKHSTKNRSDSGPTETRIVPAWQRERAGRLHRQFKRCELALHNGKSLNAALKHFEWYWRNEFYRSDPSKKVRFALHSLRGLFYQWRRGGCVPCALHLRYNPAGTSVPAWVLLRFLALVSSVEFPNMRAAWDELCRRRGWGGHGPQPTEQRIHVSFYQLRHHFGGANFREAQARLKAIADAQAALAEFRLNMAGDIRRRLPDKPKRKRRSGAALSLEAAAL